MASEADRVVVSYQFAGVQVDLRTRQLLRDGRALPLAERFFDVLVLLLTHRDRVVTKDELLSNVWPDAFVSEDSLTQAISTLRRTLGDAEYIATIPRRGYRFIGAVTPVVDSDAVPGMQPAGSVEVGAAPTATLPPVPTLRRVARLWPAAVALVGVVTLGVWLSSGSPSSDAVPLAPLLRFSQSNPPGTSSVEGGALSPDGTSLAFIARDALSGVPRLWVRTLGSNDARPMAGSEGAARPFWSPDGRDLGYFANSELRTIRLDTGAERVLGTINIWPGGASWNAAGTILFSSWGGGPLLSVPAVGGESTPVTALGAETSTTGHRLPSFLPDGERFLFFAENADSDQSGWYVGRLGTTAVRRVFDASYTHATVLEPGYLAYLRDGLLAAVPFDVESARIAGDPVVLAGEAADPARTNSVSISVAGSLAVFDERATLERLTWYGRDGFPERESLPRADLHNPSVSLDSRYVAASLGDGLARTSIWLFDLERGSETLVAQEGLLPLLSPDGRRVAYSAPRVEGGSNLYVRPTLEFRTQDALLETTGPLLLNDWSADGRFFTYGAPGPDSGQDLWIVEADPAAAPVPLLQSPANEIQSRFSPDGRWVAYASDETGSWEVYLQSLDERALRIPVSSGGGGQPQWRADGRELYYLSRDSEIMVVPVGPLPGDALEIGRPVPLFRVPVSGTLEDYRNQYVVTADGQRFLVDTVDETRRSSVSVLVNWTTVLAPA